MSKGMHLKNMEILFRNKTFNHFKMTFYAYIAVLLNRFEMKISNKNICNSIASQYFIC